MADPKDYNKLLKELKIAAEYSTLLTKISYLNAVGTIHRELSYDEFKDNIDNIAHSKLEKNMPKTVFPITVYVAEKGKEDQFKNLLKFITDSDVTMITSAYYDSIYDNTCDRLNEIEPEYQNIQNKFLKKG